MRALFFLFSSDGGDGDFYGGSCFRPSQVSPVISVLILKTSFFLFLRVLAPASTRTRLASVSAVCCLLYASAARVLRCA